MTTLDVARGEFSHRWPEFLPGSAQVLFTVGTVGEWDEAEIVVQSLETGQRTTLVKGGTHPHYLAGGFLAYTHAGAVWAAPLDLRRLALAGPPARVIEGVAASVDGAAQFAVSATGASVHLRPSPGSSARRLIMVEGSETTPLAASAHRYVTPRLSPDGRRVLVGVADDVGARLGLRPAHQHAHPDHVRRGQPVADLDGRRAACHLRLESQRRAESLRGARRWARARRNA